MIVITSHFLLRKYVLQRFPVQVLDYWRRVVVLKNVSRPDARFVVLVTQYIIYVLTLGS